MTTAGIQVVNDAGTLLFDQDYVNVALRTKGTFTIGSLGYTTIQIANAKVPMIAVRLAGGFSAYQWFSSNGTTLNFMVRGPVGAVVTYWYFDEPTAPANYGLVVYRANGTVAFDATKQYARVQDVIAGSSLTNNVGTHYYPTGRTYAVIVGKVGMYTDVVTITTGVSPNYKYKRETTNKATVVTLNGATVDISVSTEVVTDPDAGPGVFYTNDSSSWNLILLDVTGF